MPNMTVDLPRIIHDTNEVVVAQWIGVGLTISGILAIALGKNI